MLTVVIISVRTRPRLRRHIASARCRPGFCSHIGSEVIRNNSSLFTVWLCLQAASSACVGGVCARRRAVPSRREGPGLFHVSDRPQGGGSAGPPPAAAPEGMPSKPAFYFLVCLFLLAASSVVQAQQLSYLSRPRRICQIRNS